MTEPAVALLIAVLAFTAWLLVIYRPEEPTVCGIRCFPARPPAADPCALFPVRRRPPAELGACS